MKNRKVILTALTVVFATLIASAQAPLNFRIEAGPSFNFGSLKGVSDVNIKNMTGYRVGAFVDVPVYSGLYLGSGLNFTMKGSQYEMAIAASKLAFHYIEIPVNVGYRFTLSPSISLALQTGPYFAVALAATAQSGSSLSNLGSKVNLFKDGLADISDSFKARRYDVGWDLNARLYFNRYYLTCGLDFGFLNVLNNSEKGTIVSNIKDSFLNLQNKQFFIGLGITF